MNMTRKEKRKKNKKGGKIQRKEGRVDGTTWREWKLKKKRSENNKRRKEKKKKDRKNGNGKKKRGKQ